MNIFRSFLLFNLLLVSLVDAITLKEIKDPRPHSRVIDNNHYLSFNMVERIDKLCREVFSSGKGELMIVIVDKIGSDAHRKFANNILKKFGIGSAVNNNGVLIFAAMEENTVMIVPNDNIGDETAGALGDYIMYQEMIPRLKVKSYDGAFYFGVVECAKRIFHVTNADIQFIDVNTNSTSPDSVQLPPSSEKTDQTTDIKQNRDGVYRNPVFYILLALILFFVIRLIIRYMPKRCWKCKTKMIRLDEKGDDKYLEKCEITEEKIKSVDYDVWQCPSCGETKQFKYTNYLKFYSTCPECSFRTLKTRKKVVQHPTSHSTGTMHIEESCKNCMYKNSYDKTIPRESGYRSKR